MSNNKYKFHTLWGIPIYIRRKDGYVNITNLAKALEKKEGKRRDIDNWLSNQRTQTTIEHLSLEIGKPVSKLIQIFRFRGRTEKYQGTYVHPSLSIHCAVWLSDMLGPQVERWLIKQIFGFEDRDFLSPVNWPRSKTRHTQHYTD